MSGVDKKLAAVEERREQRETAHKRRVEVEAKSELGTMVELASSSSSSTESGSPRKKIDPDFVAQEPKPQSSKPKYGNG